jgi:hypothetical protein
VFAGFDDWRLPWESVLAGAALTTTVVNCATTTELACRDNEMGYMFYHDLGGTLGQNKTGTQTALGGQVLTGIQLSYWSGTKSHPFDAWLFAFLNANQGDDDVLLLRSAWAVRPGDVVAAAPEPTTLALLGLALAGFGFSRRKQ